MKPKKRAPVPKPAAGKPSSKRVDEFHRPATRSERLRAWIEACPKRQLYVVLILATWLSLTVLISIDSRTLDSLGLRGPGYEVGDIASKDVYAPSTVTYENSVATEEARQEAADDAPEVYRTDDRIPARTVDEARGFFDMVREVRASSASSEEKASRLTDNGSFHLSGEVARSLVFLENGEIDDAEQYVIENLQELYGSTAVADDDIEVIPAAVITFSEGQTRLSEAAQRDASGEVGLVVGDVSRGLLQPNYVINRQATQEARENAASEVAPVQGSVQQGERIVARGEVIDRVDLMRLQAVGQIGSPNPWTVLLGVALVVAAEMGVAWYFVERFGSRILKTKAVLRMVLAASLTILFTALARLFVLLSFNPYLIPLAGLSIIGTILLGPRLMFLIVVVSGINVGIIGGNDFLLSAALLISSGFAIYTVVRVSSRNELLRAGLFIAGIMAIVTFAVSLIGGAAFGVALWQGVLGLGNGLLSLMLAMVLLPLLENLFNILTPMKLLELSNPTHPLIHKLLQKAPGTFSHSMQVGVLAENAAERIGADALLARVGAYYHDVGKIEHPAYFIENQISASNPHATLSPALSAKVIKRHVKDGLEIGHAWDLPEEILDIIAQHHGTTRIEYFYRKALESALNGENVRESDFRYNIGRPKSKEAGIVMVADTVEATVKALAKPTPKRIEDIVDDTINGKIDDGQFDECALTMREIHEVGEAVREALIGFLGPRIEYPESDTAEPKAMKNAP